jgi:hypothetical protein
LWRWLDDAVKRSLVHCEGKGSKSDPFRYWLPEREAVWKEDPLYAALEEQRVTLRLPFQSLTERKKILGQRPGSSGEEDGGDSRECGEDL